MAYADPKIVVEDSLLTGNGYDPVRDKVLELRRQRSKEQLDVYALPTLADVPKYFAEDDLKLHDHSFLLSVLKYIIWQNIRTQEGIEVLASQYTQENPGAIVRRDTEPRRLFTKEQLEVYGEAPLRAVVVRIHELLVANGIQSSQSRFPHSIKPGQTSSSRYKPLRLPSMQTSTFSPQDARSGIVTGLDGAQIPQHPAMSHIHHAGITRLWFGGMPPDFNMPAMNQLLAPWQPYLHHVEALRPVKGATTRQTLFCTASVSESSVAEEIIKTLHHHPLPGGSFSLKVDYHKPLRDRVHDHVRVSLLDQGEVGEGVAIWTSDQPRVRNYGTDVGMFAGTATVFAEDVATSVKGTRHANSDLELNNVESIEGTNANEDPKNTIEEEPVKGPCETAKARGKVKRNIKRSTKRRTAPISANRQSVHEDIMEMKAKNDPVEAPASVRAHQQETTKDSSVQQNLIANQPGMSKLPEVQERDTAFKQAGENEVAKAEPAGRAIKAVLQNKVQPLAPIPLIPISFPPLRRGPSGASHVQINKSSQSILRDKTENIPPQQIAQEAKEVDVGQGGAAAAAHESHGCTVWCLDIADELAALAGECDRAFMSAPHSNDTLDFSLTHAPIIHDNKYSILKIANIEQGLLDNTAPDIPFLPATQTARSTLHQKDLSSTHEDLYERSGPHAKQEILEKVISCGPPSITKSTGTTVQSTKKGGKKRAKKQRQAARRVERGGKDGVTAEPGGNLPVIMTPTEQPTGFKEKSREDALSDREEGLVIEPLSDPPEEIVELLLVYGEFLEQMQREVIALEAKRQLGLSDGSHHMELLLKGGVHAKVSKKREMLLQDLQKVSGKSEEAVGPAADQAFGNEARAPCFQEVLESQASLESSIKLVVALDHQLDVYLKLRVLMLEHTQKAEGDLQTQEALLRQVRLDSDKAQEIEVERNAALRGILQECNHVDEESEPAAAAASPPIPKPSKKNRHLKKQRQKAKKKAAAAANDDTAVGSPVVPADDNNAEKRPGTPDTGTTVVDDADEGDSPSPGPSTSALAPDKKGLLADVDKFCDLKIQWHNRVQRSLEHHE